MATPFNTPETQLLHEIFGIPTVDSVFLVGELSHRNATIAREWDATYSTGNLTTIRTAFNAQLATISTDTRIAVLPLMDEWKAIRASPMRLDTGDAGETGVIADHEKNRELLRASIGNMLGIWCPKGGFFADATRDYGQRQQLGDR